MRRVENMFSLTDDQRLATQLAVANSEALRRLLACQPIWLDVRPAIEVLPGMTEHTVLHAGPPIAWDRMCSAQRIGVIAGILYEGLAETSDDAERLVEAGQITLASCHDHAAVGGMAGITTSSMPVAVVRNEAFGNCGYSQLFQGPATQDWKEGDYTTASIARWRFLATVLGPALGAAIRLRGGLDVKSLMAQALQMGDECHNRNSAGSALLIKELVPYLLRAGLSRALLLETVDYLSGADQFSLTLAMAASKSAVDPTKNIPFSTMVTAMCRNGTDFGIKLSGLGDAWFTAPANPVQGLFFASEWGPEDAGLDMGDSAIMETVGLGGFVQVSAPALQQFVGGSFRRARELTLSMGNITLGVNLDYRLPNLDFAGAPAGIDALRVVSTGIEPIIDTAIAHRLGGVIGAGQARAPIGCFQAAVAAFEREYDGMEAPPT